MNHLLANLLRLRDPAALVQLIGVVACGCGLVSYLVTRPASRVVRQWVRQWLDILASGVILTAVAWLGFRAALVALYPQLTTIVPLGSGLVALACCLLGSTASMALYKLTRSSARNMLLFGSLLSSGVSCMVFIAMTGVVRPFALAYDLGGVMTVMLAGAALATLAFRRLGAGGGVWGHASAAAKLTLSVSGILLGSLCAILPFGDWLVAARHSDDLAFSPIAIIVAVEGATVVLLALSGALVDHRVAARHRSEADRLRQLVDGTLEGILIHRHGEILDGNLSVATLLNSSLDELRGTGIFRLMPHAADAELWRSGSGAVQETEILDCRGSTLPVDILSRDIVYGGSPAVVTALRDVRQRRESEARIRFLAHHDVLTELPNRAMLNESLQLALRLVTPMRGSLSVLCLDLDGFKGVNDTLGHAAGDKLLCLVAARMRACIASTDIVARIGGDEFVVVQTAGSQPDHATALAGRIIACLQEPFEIDGQIVNVGASIGIAVCPQDGQDAETLMKHADIALYRAKASGRGMFCMFAAGMDKALQARRELEQELRLALQRDQLTLHFQPLFNGARSLIAFEALVRWTHPKLGAVSPADFIPVAEDCGLIMALGEWVLRTACRTAMGWPETCRVAVNLSPAQFHRSDLPAMVSQVLTETGLSPRRLELEVTEGVLIENAQGALDTLSALRALGVRLVLDDFGTGYSSLSYLHQYPFDKLKVDRSFVQRLEGDSSSRAIVNAIISMSQNLNLEVTAEGVETEAQLELLCAQGCHELQGFLLGRPMPFDALSLFIDKADRPGPDMAILVEGVVAVAASALP